MQIFHQQGLYNLNHFLLSHTRQARCARLSHKWARGGSNCKRQIWNELCSCCYPRWSAQCHQGSPNILVFLMFKPCTACCSIIVWTEIIYVVFQWCYACFSYCYAKNCINKQDLSNNQYMERVSCIIHFCCTVVDFQTWPKVYPWQDHRWSNSLAHGCWYDTVS